MPDYGKAYEDRAVNLTENWYCAKINHTLFWTRFDYEIY